MDAKSKKKKNRYGFPGTTMKGNQELTIWGKSKESFPIVLKTKSCNLFTVTSKSSPNEAIF